jgi:hypothetical protein
VVQLSIIYFGKVKYRGSYRVKLGLGVNKTGGTYRYKMVKWDLHDLRPPLLKFKSKKMDLLPSRSMHPKKPKKKWTFLPAGACTRKKLKKKMDLPPSRSMHPKKPKKKWTFSPANGITKMYQKKKLVLLKQIQETPQKHEKK